MFRAEFWLSSGHYITQRNKKESFSLILWLDTVHSFLTKSRKLIHGI